MGKNLAETLRRREGELGNRRNGRKNICTSKFGRLAINYLFSVLRVDLSENLELLNRDNPPRSSLDFFATLRLCEIISKTLELR